MSASDRIIVGAVCVGKVRYRCVPGSWGLLPGAVYLSRGWAWRVAQGESLLPIIAPTTHSVCGEHVHSTLLADSLQGLLCRDTHMSNVNTRVTYLHFLAKTKLSL